MNKLFFLCFLLTIIYSLNIYYCNDNILEKANANNEDSTNDINDNNKNSSNKSKSDNKSNYNKDQYNVDDEYNEDEENDDEEGEDDENDHFEVPINCSDGNCFDSMDNINKIIDNKKKKMKYRRRRGKAIQIIKPNINHTELIIIEENLEIFKRIDKPIAIVSVLGDMHTGKSFLLNLLNEHVIPDINKSNKYIENGFKVGNDITASTYGIWIWSEPIRINVKKLKKIYEYINENFTNFIKSYEYEKDEYNEEIIDLLNLYKTDDWISNVEELNLSDTDEVNLILMDTQGLNSPNVNKRYDEILYALTNLISTDIIFLTMKMINNKDLEFIENITKDANLFMLRAYTRSSGSTFSIKKNNFHKILDTLNNNLENNSLILESIASKNLMWVVHDFSQRLDVRKGKLWLDILLNSDRRDLDIKYWKKIISNKSKDKHDAYTTKKQKIAYLTYNDNSSSGLISNNNNNNNDSSTNYKLNILYKNIDCVLLRNMYHNKEFDFTKANINDLNEEYKNDVLLLRYKIYLRALLFPKKMYSDVQMNKIINKIRREQKLREEQEKSKEQKNKDNKKNDTNNNTDDLNSNKDESSGSQITNRFMSGHDVYDFITFLVKSANQNLFTNVNQFFKHFKINRAEISRNDLIFLYKKYLLQFMENEDVEFISNLNDENDDLFLQKEANNNSINVDANSEEDSLFNDDEIMQLKQHNLKDEQDDIQQKKDNYKLPPLLNEIKKYEELIREQILNIWYKYTESDFHDEEEKELIKDIENNLYERLDQIKIEMLELGEMNIRKFCKIACEDALQIVVEDVKMKSDQYPIKQKDLTTFFESVSYNLIKYLEKKLSKNSDKLDLIYYKDNICNPLINNTFQEFYFLKKKNMTLNENRLKSYFSNAVSKGKEVFEVLAENTENITEYFKNKNMFYTVLDKWTSEAINTYTLTLSDFAKEEKDINDEYLNVLNDDIKLLKQKAMEKWHNHCRDKTSALFNMHKSNLKKNFLENFNFPLDELVLQDIFLNLKGQEELKYMDIYCANEDSWNSEYKNFLKLTDEVYQFIKDENLKAIQITCQQPLDELKNGIKGEIHKYYLWSSLKSTLYNRALIVLSSNIENIYIKNQRENKIQSNLDEKYSSTNKNYKRISKDLMSKVINRWLNNDIYNLYYPIIRKQFLHRIVCYFGIAILLFIISLVVYFKKFHASFLFLIILALFMIFGYQQISIYGKTFFRHVVFYMYEGIANVFGTEGAIIVSILFISVTAIYVYNYHIVKFKNRVAKNTKKLLQSQNIMNMSGANSYNEYNPSSKMRIFKPNFWRFHDYDKDPKYHAPNMPHDYKMHNDSSQYMDLKNRSNRPNKMDDYTSFNNSSKFQRRSYLD
ncbi:conserved Plasmodium protein, unknown function [Plasmodium gaboni]|uniref:Guanylate-binding protein N-terminal domain-containing protein n=1 Tax=Plasmodium gaboni TaxID=647221 RepID=A0ABY1UVW2_9APIC|nr:conserved Plasmodium protein, unknown function [Plasmodium gaboni]